MTQLKLLKAGLPSIDPVPDAFAIMIEFLVGRFTEEMDIQHADPTNMMSANTSPANPDAEPMANAFTIPLFRAIYDNVKLGRITTRESTDAGRRAWITANNMLTFGNIFSLVRPAWELIPVFSQRFVLAPFYNFPGIPNQDLDPIGPFTKFNDEGAVSEPPLGGGDAVGINQDDTGVFHIQPNEVFNAPFYEYAGDLMTAMRGDIPSLGNGANGFLKWHNGTIRRLPTYTITQIGGAPFTGVPGVELGPDPETEYTMTPVYTTEFPSSSPDPYPNPVGPYIVPGMFQAPADLPEHSEANSLAFIVTNPWVDPTETANFEIQFVLDPSDYPGWAVALDGGTYNVTRYDVSGNPATLLGSFAGPFNHAETLSGGEIVWFVFRK